MESVTKPQESLSPILNDLLGGANSRNLSTIDLSFDGSSSLRQEKLPARALSLEIEDTKSEWASMRSYLKPTTGDWIQPRDQILESHVDQNLDANQEAMDPQNLETQAEDKEKNEILNLLNEATLYLKEELTVIKSELSNIHQYKGAIQNLGAKIGESEGGLGVLSEKFNDTAWVIGQKLDGIDSKFEHFKDDLPASHKNSNELIINALREFEEKCLRLGAAQLESISRIQGVEGRTQVEELQESLIYLITGQKKIFDSISDVLKSLKTVSLSISNLPGHEMLEQIAEKQEDQIDSIKLEIVESRIEDRGGDRFLRGAVMILGFICVLTFGAIVYSILV